MVVVPCSGVWRGCSWLLPPAENDHKRREEGGTHPHYGGEKGKEQEKRKANNYLCSEGEKYIAFTLHVSARGTKYHSEMLNIHSLRTKKSTASEQECLRNNPKQ